MHIPPPSPVSRRNDFCQCGSGQKYKHCCGQIRQATSASEILIKARESVRLGNLQNAEKYFQQLITLNPLHAEGLAGLGQCLCWRQKTAEGIIYLQQAALVLQKTSHQGLAVRPLIDLCTQVLHWGDLATALSLAETAEHRAPDNAAALNNLALCYSRCNRDQDALVYAKRACKILPDDPGCNILLAILETRLGNLDSAQHRLQHILQVCKDPAQTARATLELGIVLDKLGQFDQAFEAFSSAGAKHLALPEIQGINAETIFTTLRDNRANFDPSLLRRWSVEELSGDSLPTPIFLFGFLRSGTTLAEQVFAAHPSIVTSNEEPFIAELINELRRKTLSEKPIPELLKNLNLEQVRQLRRFYWRLITEKYGDRVKDSYFIDKMALNSIEAGLISCIFPDAKIIFALRDPRDVCLSCFMQAFNPSPATVNLLSWTGIARQYCALMDFWLAIRQHLAPAVLTLKYEAAVHDFETTYRQVFDFLEVDWQPECEKFYTQVQGKYIATPSFSAVHQPIYTTAVGRWHNYSRHFVPILPQLQRFITAFEYN